MDAGSETGRPAQDNTASAVPEVPAMPRRRVICDDREADSPVVAALRARGDVTVILARMLAGDYQVEGTQVLFERKTLPDFAVSLIDGRLFSQAARLRQLAPGRAVVILEGDSRELAATGVSREALQGALVALTVVFGIAVLRASDATESARLICYAAGQMRRAATGAIPRPGYRPRRLANRQLYLLQGLPGVGSKRAALLLETFGSVAAVCNAGLNALQGVHGIGPETAERMHTLLHAPWEAPKQAPMEP